MSLFKLLGEVIGFSNKCPVVSDDCCAICLNPITIGGRIDCCKHTFCLDCIKQWSERSNRCPQCRSVFRYITPCRVFASEEQLHNCFSYSTSFCNKNMNLLSSRIKISDINSNARGGCLYLTSKSSDKKRSSVELYSKAGMTCRYSSR